MLALIMAGGIGSRFWPKSRKSNPKQFLSITNKNSMIVNTVNRLLSRISIENIYIVTAEEQASLVKKHLKNLPEENIIQEPFGRNTAPCIGLSIEYLLRKHDKQEQVLVLPADHLIDDTDLFWEYTDKASKIAKEDFLVTFGIQPTYPATGYGYIQAGNTLAENVFHVKQFKEKPNLETATDFLLKGNFFWNSGMFLWSLEKIKKEFSTLLPAMNNLMESISKRWQTQGLTANISDIYEKMPKIPIDIGIMEQSTTRAVVSVDYAWNDVGSWKAFYDVNSKDENGNVLKATTYLHDAKNNLIISDKFVAAIGIENLAIVETNDAILISKITDSEKVKNVVEYLKKEKEDLL